MRLAVAIIALALAVTTPARADPCKAIPDNGPTPAWIKPGARFSGSVRHIIDGDGFCVGNTADPGTWVEVRLADFDAPELRTKEGRAAKAALSRIAHGRSVQCVVTPGRNGRAVSYDRAIATCSLGGRSLRQHLQAAGLSEGGN